MSLKKTTKIFFGTTFVVFLLLFGIVVMLTVLKQKTYAGVAVVRLKAAGKPVDFAIQTNALYSEAVLSPVVDALKLNTIYGKRHRIDDEFKSWESILQLRQQITVSEIPSSAPNALDMQIVIEDEESAEAAKIANQVAESLCAHDTGGSMGIVHRAEPNTTPIWPSYPLFLGGGAFVSMGIAFAVGRTAMLLSDAMERGAKQIEGKQA